MKHQTNYFSSKLHRTIALLLFQFAARGRGSTRRRRRRTRATRRQRGQPEADRSASDVQQQRHARHPGVQSVCRRRCQETWGRQPEADHQSGGRPPEEPCAGEEAATERGRGWTFAAHHQVKLWMLLLLNNLSEKGRTRKSFLGFLNKA